MSSLKGIRKKGTDDIVLCKQFLVFKAKGKKIREGFFQLRMKNVIIKASLGH